jgi:hypothetical protein
LPIISCEPFEREEEEVGFLAVEDPVREVLEVLAEPVGLLLLLVLRLVSVGLAVADLPTGLLVFVLLVPPALIADEPDALLALLPDCILPLVLPIPPGVEPVPIDEEEPMEGLFPGEVPALIPLLMPVPPIPVLLFAGEPEEGELVF